MVPVITIDGPSGAGKGTLCRLVANNTSYSLLDSGALYRLTALASLNKGIDLNNENEVMQVAKGLDICFSIVNNSTVTLLEGKDVSLDIRAEEVGMAASKVAAYPLVREALLQRQRDFCQAPGLVADGRDMGTVVFPEAQVKIFLTASAHERAIRRVKQIEESGQKADFDKILKDIEARDEKDSSRASAPLKPAEDALMLDSTELSIEQVLDVIMSEVEKKITL